MKLLEVRNDYTDVFTNLRHIDGWFEDNEEGKTIAVVDQDTNKVIIFDHRFGGDKEVKVAIQECLDQNIILNKMKLVIDAESVNIYQDNGEDYEPTHIVYWHIDEIEEDASVFQSVANAIDLFHTNKKGLLDILGRL